MDKEDLAALIEGEAEAVAEVQPEVTERPPLDTESPEAGETPTLPAPPAPPEPGHVPVAALRDERDKRKALERQVAELKAQKADVPPPEETTAQQMWALRMDVSRELITSQVGEAEAQALHEWGEAKCGSDPHFNQQVFASKNPYAFLRQARQREQLLAEVSPDDLDDYKAWKASRAQGGQAPAPTPQPTPVPTPPRSLANAPNAGGAGAQAEIPMGPGAAFASTIRR